MNPAQRFFKDAVWQTAFEAYMGECGSELWRAPKAVQEQYKEKARQELRGFLAECGIV